jgi:hypothetical protein
LLSKPGSRVGGVDFDATYFETFYFDFAFCAAQRFRCASAILLRASGLSTRFFLLLVGPLVDLLAELDELIDREPASKERT